MFKKTALIVGLISGIVLSYAGVASATLKVVQTPTYHLYSGESGTATSMRIAPYPTDLDGVKLTMSDFGDLPTVTVDPKITNTEEIESFTGIVDNGDNTATLTGVSRDLQSKYPYTGIGTGRTHGSGATVVFGNNPQVYGRLWAPENNATSTATLAFSSTTPPHYDQEPANWTLVNPESFVSYAKLAATAIAGAVNASTIQNGIVQLATAAQAASSTATGSTAANLALWASYATSTPGLAGLWSVMSLNDGNLSPSWLDGTLENYVFNATSTFNQGFISNASTTFMATTSSLGFSIFGASTSTIAGSLQIAKNATTTNLTVSGVCSGCTNPVTVTNTGTLQTSTGLQTTVTATCATGKEVTGGGYSGISNTSAYQQQVVQNSPSGNNAWATKVFCEAGTCTADTLTVYAICVNP